MSPETPFRDGCFMLSAAGFLERNLNGKVASPCLMRVLTDFLIANDET